MYLSWIPVLVMKWDVKICFLKIKLFRSCFYNYQAFFMNLYLWVFLATWQEPRLQALVSRPPFKQNNLVNSQDVIIIRIGSPSSFFKGQMYVCMGAQGAYRDYPLSSNSLVNYHDSASRTIIIGLPSPFKQISIVNYWKIIILKKKPPPSNKKKTVESWILSW